MTTNPPRETRRAAVPRIQDPLARNSSQGETTTNDHRRGGNTIRRAPARRTPDRVPRTAHTYRLLAALLDIAPDELLRVLLEHGIDLVQQIVDIFGQLFVPLGSLGARFGCRCLIDLFVASGLARLRLS